MNDTTNSIDIEALSTVDLKRLTAAASETIESRRADEQAAAMNQIKSLIKDNELDMADVIAFISPKAKRGRKPGSTTGSKAAGPKSPPKYREPVSGATWTGKGRKPEWIKAAADPEVYLIPAGEQTKAPAPKAPKTSTAVVADPTPVPAGTEQPATETTSA